MGVNRTNSVNHFHIKNDIKNIQGNFVYRKFEPFEQVDEQLEKIPSWCKDGEPYPIVYDNPGTQFSNESNVSRYVELEWEGDPIDYDIFQDTDLDLTQGQQIFFNSDLQQGMVLYSTSEQDDIQSQNYIISDIISEKSKLDYLLSQSRQSPFTEQIEEDLKQGAAASEVPVLEPTTMKPITKTSTNDRLPAPDVLLKAQLNKQIISTSYRSPFTGENLFDQIDVADSLGRKIDAFPRGLPFFNFRTVFERSENTIEDNLYVFDSTDTGLTKVLKTEFTLVGYAIIKYRIDNNVKSYMYTRFVRVKNYRDPYVAYGKTYQYEIRPVYAIYRDPTTKRVYILGSDESVNIKIECTELKVPQPPTSLSFSYEGESKIKISWRKASTFVQDDNKLWKTNDTKGYQILYRHSLTEPYRLLKYFKFNNTTPKKYRMYSPEFIPDIYVINLETDITEITDKNGAPIYIEPTEYTMEIRSNMDYYFTMCSIDAHGNSSNYSTQFRVRRNNVTGEVQISVVSPQGAPKQYPNLLIPNELVEPVMKISGYKYLDIYYCPDTIRSKPNVNIGAPSFNLQMFELETQTEKNIKIQIDEEQN